MTHESILLEARDFETGQHPYPKFMLHNTTLRFGDVSIQNCQLAARYNKDMRLEIEYKDSGGKYNIPFMIDKVELDGSMFSNRIELLIANQTTKSGGPSEFILTPKIEPLLINFSDTATEIKAIIMNGPDNFLSKLEFRHDDYLLILEDFANTRSNHKESLSLKREYVATGTVTLRHKEGALIDSETALITLTHLNRFLTFVKGTHCGIGNIVGSNGDGKVAYAHLGFLRMDQFKVSTGWCDLNVFKSLPEIYKLYTKAVCNQEHRKPLLTTIEYYRASNIIRETSLEMAVVASHAALETIVPHILRSKAGWSNNLLSKQISFNDKLRAAAQFVGLSDSPYENLEALQKRSKEQSNVDAYELLSIFRNRIVHQGKPFKYTGTELMEVWNLSQWLCEIFLFYWLDYRGEMNDRRQYQGWRGEMIKPVPLP